MSIDLMFLHEYTLMTELAVHKFIEENELSVENQQKLHKQIEDNLSGAYYVADYVHTIADLLSKSLDLSEEVTKLVAKNNLLRGNLERKFDGYLEKVNKEQLIYAMLDFLEQNGYLEEFLRIWKDQYE